MAAPFARAEPPPASPAESLTVLECVARARARSPEPVIAMAERDAASLDSTATFRSRRVAYSIEGGAMVAPEHFYDPAFTNLGQYTLRLGAQAPLWDGGSRQRDRRRSGLATAVSRAALDQAMRDAGLRAGALAIEWLRLAENLHAQGEAVNWLDHLASVMESGVRSGLRGRADALRAVLERDAAAATLDLTRRDLASTRRALARELAGDDDPGPVIRDEGDLGIKAPAAADSLALFAALGDAPEVRLAGLGEADRRLDLEAAEHRQAWQLGLAADAGLAGTNLTRAVPPELSASDPGATFASRLHRDLGASLSLQLRRPLFDGSAAAATSARRAAARAQHLRLASEAAAQRRLALDLIARWRSAAHRFEATRAVAELADEHLLRLESLHAAGAATLLELLEARRTLDDARGRLADARAQARGAHLEAEVRR